MPTKNISRTISFTIGTVMSINFAIFWAVPVMGMGLVWKHGLKGILMPIYDVFDKSTTVRLFAADYIYTNPQHADFFVTTMFIVLNCMFCLGTVFYWQLTTGQLPWWLIAAYLCSWVGFGGRVMGGAYTLAHKEGHNHTLYKKWIRQSLGHIFENVIGVFFGNVPWNFTTSHIFIHHRLDGGIGDTFYEWDLDRSNLGEFMLYVARIFSHVIGYSSIRFFDANGLKSKSEQLKNGVYMYCAVGTAILAITRSFSFLFWIYLQPLMCMTYFLALLNYGFHGFIEFDENGKTIPCVDASTIIGGDDDYFGEDDHMAHHYQANVYYRDLPALQKSKEEEFKKYKASVFRGLSIVELSIFLLFGLWDKLADHFVDYSGTMSRDEIKSLLKTRAQRRQITYEEYEDYLQNPTAEARKALAKASEEKNKTKRPPSKEKKVVKSDEVMSG